MSCICLCSLWMFAKLSSLCTRCCILHWLYIIIYSYLSSFFFFFLHILVTINFSFKATLFLYVYFQITPISCCWMSSGVNLCSNVFHSTKDYCMHFPSTLFRPVGRPSAMFTLIKYCLMFAVGIRIKMSLCFSGLVFSTQSNLPSPCLMWSEVICKIINCVTEAE